MCALTNQSHKQTQRSHLSARRSGVSSGNMNPIKRQVAPKFVHKINKSDSLKQIMFHPTPKSHLHHPTNPRPFFDQNLVLTFDINRLGSGLFARIHFFPTCALIKISTAFSAPFTPSTFPSAAPPTGWHLVGFPTALPQPVRTWDATEGGCFHVEKVTFQVDLWVPIFEEMLANCWRIVFWFDLLSKA